MNSRERIAALMRHEIPDRMGLFEHFWADTVPTWNRDTVKVNGWVGDQFDYDIYPHWNWFDTAPYPGVREVLEDDGERVVIKDGRGTTTRSWKNKPGAPEHLSFDCISPEVWNKKYREALVNGGMDHLKTLDLEASRKTLEEKRAAGKYITFHNLFVVEQLRAMLGDAHYLPALLEEPDWIRDFCRVYLDFYKRVYSLLFERVGKPDALFLYEDIAYSNGLFCSPKVLDNLLFPFHREMVGFLHDHGVTAIMHTDGDIRKAVSLIQGAGFDCLQGLEAKAGMDVRDLFSVVGNRLCLMGNINIMKMESNDPRIVEEEIVPKLRFMSEHRIPYVFHSDHSIPPTVTFDTYSYMVDLLKKHGTY